MYTIEPMSASGGRRDIDPDLDVTDPGAGSAAGARTAAGHVPSGPPSRPPRQIRLEMPS
jgi:hypothetical protein